MAISKKTLATSLGVIGVSAAFFVASAIFENAELDTQADLLGQRNMLSVQERSDLPPSWQTQQKEITLATGDAKLVNMAYREGIVIVPGSGPTTLVASDSHGCLTVDPAKSNKDNGADVRSLLGRFNPHQLGTYTAKGFMAGGDASAICQKPAPVVK